MNKHIIAALASTAMLIGLAGCTNWERTTYDALSASQAVINQAQTDYDCHTLGTVAATTGCPLPHSKAVYDALMTARLAQTNAVNQMVSYEELKAAGATSSALGVAQGQVASALVQIPADIAEIKALYGGTK